MNKNIIPNILTALLLTIISALLLNNYKLEDNIIVFVGGFIMLFIWQWFINRMKPVRVTKEVDEILHPVTQMENTLHVVNVQKHYGKTYNPKFLEKCSNCGSTIFRIYNEDTNKGTYIQFICVKCNQKATGLEFSWKEEKI